MFFLSIVFIACSYCSFVIFSNIGISAEKVHKEFTSGVPGVSSSCFSLGGHGGTGTCPRGPVPMLLTYCCSYNSEVLPIQQKPTVNMTSPEHIGCGIGLVGMN